MPEPAPVRSQLDPRSPTFVAIFGQKGSGKSFLARRFFDTYPYDRLVVDINGDIAGLDELRVGGQVTRDPGYSLSRGEPPERWPLNLERRRRTTVRYIPDPGSKTYADDLDRAIGLAYNHRRTLLWIDEIGEATKANRTPPYMRRVLHQGRHRDLSGLWCGPRPVDVDPLVIGNANYVYVFKMPHPLDQGRIAQVIGYPPKAFQGAVQGLGEHEYLRWDGHELVHFPKLPPTASMDREQRFAGS